MDQWDHVIPGGLLRSGSCREILERLVWLHEQEPGLGCLSTFQMLGLPVTDMMVQGWMIVYEYLYFGFCNMCDIYLYTHVYIYITLLYTLACYMLCTYMFKIILNADLQSTENGGNFHIFVATLRRMMTI